ncbi:hypothetical protein M758_1G160900 [Ceratodon purpureus]|nr:hypothetical protein M758_1G160900 [Ceratodon purpureus]
MEKVPIENWNSSRLRAAEAMVRNMEAHVRLLEKQRDFLSVWKADKLKSLETQVKQLEQQRDFLALWKPDVHSGLDSEGSHVDVQLVAKDAGRVHAHKAILAAKSQEFENLFRVEVKDNLVEMADMSHEELSTFVKFFYTASVDPKLLVKHSPSLLQAADKYKVEYLRLVCEEALVANICKENAISMFVVAKKYCSEAVLDAMLKEATSMGELSTFDQYKQYCQTDAKLLLELYEKFLELKKTKSSKKRRAKDANAGAYSPSQDLGAVSQNAENNTAEPLEEIVITNVFEAMNAKGEADGLVEDTEKGKDKAKLPKSEGGRKKLNDNVTPGTPGRIPMPYDTPMMQGSPYGIPPFMPPFMPPYMSAMYPGNSMHAFFGAQRPPVIVSTEPPVNHLKPLALKKDVQTKRSQTSNKKLEEASVVSTLPQGVVWKKKLYRASIVVNGKNYVLGNSKSLEEATHMYDRAAFVCGRETNAELSEKEKQELEGLLWEEFLDFPTESESEEKKKKHSNSEAGVASSILPQSWLEEY